MDLLKVTNLKKYFKIDKKTLKAVDGLTLSIKKGETLGLVGESGCGKSTAGRTIIRMYNPTDGQIIFGGKDITNLSQRNLAVAKREMQMIFQDPYASLNPRMTVRDIIAEPLDIHKISQGKERNNRVDNLLELMGLSIENGNRFPHEFSGGQRQRIGIARALAMDPKFIVCDEPISALDVSIQAQIVNLLKSLQTRRELTYLFIAHDLSMVKYISDRILVMYLGNMVELSDSEEICNNPLNPYTQALLSAVPLPNPDDAKNNKRVILEGDVPSPIDPPLGCVFNTRCPKAMEKCKSEKPIWQEVKENHFVACHLYE